MDKKTMRMAEVFLALDKSTQRVAITAVGAVVCVLLATVPACVAHMERADVERRKVRSAETKTFWEVTERMNAELMRKSKEPK